MKYKASLDPTAKMLTGLAFVLIAWAVFKLGLHNHQHIYRFVILACVLAVLMFCYMCSVQSYEVNNDHLIIHRKIGNRNIKLSEIQEIKLVSKEDLGWAIRAFGNGGFFGYSGLFYFSKIKWVWLSASQRAKYILILTKNGRKRIITPDDTGLAELVNSTIQGLNK